MASIIKASVTINKPVSKVWELFMNPDNLSHWLTCFISITFLEGRYGQPGSRYKLLFKERGKEMEFTEKVLQIEPLQHYRFDVQHKMLSSENDFRFISFGEYTEVIQTIHPFPKGFFMKLMMPFIKKSMEKRMKDDLISFKKFVENN